MFFFAQKWGRGLSGLLNPLLQQLPGQLDLIAVWRIDNPEIQSRASLNNALAVGEKLKAMLTVIAAYPGIPHTAERQMSAGYMGDCIIHTTSPKETLPITCSSTCLSSVNR